MGDLRYNIFKTLEANYRQDHLWGRPYIVAPVVPIVAGVLNGELVPLGEIAPGYESWNGRPVTLGHPVVDGTHVTANHPQVVEAFTIGQLFNVALDDQRLTGEIWIDIQVAEQSEDGRELLEKLREGEPVEVSTAYFRDLEPMAGDLNGIPYKGVARGMKPDHLAILLHTLGACSWADGCGVPRTNTESGESEMNKKKKTDQEMVPVEPVEPTEDPIVNLENPVDPDPEPKDTLTWLERFTSNIKAALFGNEEESFEEQWNAVIGEFYYLMDSGQPIGDVGDGYVMKVWTDHIVVERSDGKFFSIDYTKDAEGKIEFTTVVEGVMAFQPNAAEEENEEEDDGADELVPESDKAPDQAAVNDAAPEADDPADVDDDNTEDPESDKAPDAEPIVDNAEEDDSESEAEEPTDPVENRCQDYIELVDFADAQAGPGWALTVLQDAVEAEVQLRQGLIEKLAANDACAFNAKDLEAMNDETLTKLDLTVGAPVANYSGQPEPVTPKPENPTGTRRQITLPPLSGGPTQ